MKKLSLILAGALLLGGISFAKPVVKQQADKAKTEKKTDKKVVKTDKKTVKTDKKVVKTDKKTAK